MHISCHIGDLNPCSQLSEMRHYKYFCSTSALHFCISCLYQLNFSHWHFKRFKFWWELISFILSRRLLNCHFKHSHIGIPNDASIWSTIPVKEQGKVYPIHTDPNNQLCSYTTVKVLPPCPCVRKERSRAYTFSWTY